jgi:hypothetical protein
MKKCSYDEGVTWHCEPEIVHEANITHNLNEMADKAGIYKALWRPEELGIKKASELINPLENGIEELKSKPDYYKIFNPSNGWGAYENLISFTQEYLDACKLYPEAFVSVDR